MRSRYNEAVYNQDSPGILFPAIGFIASVLVVITIVGYFIVFGQWSSSKVKEVVVTEKVLVPDTASAEELKKLQVKITEQNTQLTAAATIRSEIAKELKAKLDPLKLNIAMDMEKGNIRFNDGLIFESNGSTLSQKAKDYINTFFPVYVQVLFEGKYKDYIDGIVVEGHADDGGSYILNIELSEKRSLNTVKYIIERKLVPVEITDAYLIFSGRAFAQPVMVNGTVDRNLSRRVEFSFRLKEDKISKDIQRLLQ